MRIRCCEHRRAKLQHAPSVLISHLKNARHACTHTHRRVLLWPVVNGSNRASSPLHLLCCLSGTWQQIQNSPNPYKHHHSHLTQSVSHCQPLSDMYTCTVCSSTCKDTQYYGCANYGFKMDLGCGNG